MIVLLYFLVINLRLLRLFFCELVRGGEIGMSKIIKMMFIMAVMGGCQSSSIYGSGPVSLSDSTKRLYQNYLSKDAPLAFVISEDGTRGNYSYCGAGNMCVDDSYGTISRCETRTGKRCFVFAEYGKIVWKGYQDTDGDQDESAVFSVNVFGDNIIFSGDIFPGSSEKFTMHIGEGNYCQGFYKTGPKFSVQLNCDADSSNGVLKKGNYKGESQSISWKKGVNIDLKSPGNSTLEMRIHPYNGEV